MLPPVATLGKGAKAAREFEAQLIGTVLASMEKTFAAIPGQDPIAGEDDYNYLGTEALASAIAAGGGFGIAKLISHHLGARR
jgi:Rod binding domain-containing protein